LKSLYKATPVELYRLIVVDGGSTDGTKEYLSTQPIDLTVLGHYTSPGAAKNKGVEEAGDCEFLYISDSDMYFKAGWLETLMKAYTDETAILGALGHPWWPTIGRTYVGGVPGEKAGVEVCFAEQQPGYSWFMRREIWDKCGPLQVGVDYGVDDTEFCSKAKELGLKVGHLKEELVLHCGIKRADGSITYGAQDQIKDYPEEVITE
jgi:glycosyltransferase involved in cell wall biosynthesis